MLETIYYIGQTIAVVAILGSVVALVIQLQQSNRLARAEMSLSAWLPSIRYFSESVNSEETSAFFHKALFTDQKLTDPERMRFSHFAAYNTNSLETLFYLEKEGLCNQTILLRHIEGTEYFLRSPRMRHWWAATRDNYYLPEFREFFDTLVSRYES
ncbi:hypothetical protein V0U79_11335 [Hyphobacterium sp. HN65]|uniref:DUF4760 domain-containing protein n=1 Tax=Hyphobacterium lacteum TaxID=3116575 RepID=A0ABU7LUE5_9PROT|nr:hypothetical protein [Hyphobacterium sp. HN65]MEE2526964.1 hypothetical protein [Hyphobacterium sp. HN65]